MKVLRISPLLLTCHVDLGKQSAFCFSVSDAQHEMAELDISKGRSNYNIPYLVLAT